MTSAGFTDFSMLRQGKPMYWIKLILTVAILFVVLLLGVEFSTLNAEPVTVKYLFGEARGPLSLVAIGAFAVGVLLTALIGAFMLLPLRWQVARLRQSLFSKEQEFNLLAKKVGREAR
ncbi:MAG TPA: hypothetical protein DIC59_00855 [Candidatus Competibacteraceae bacterium]|nr:hypothetical protein [Candidatus Competibacteraceae bacterium]